MHTFVKKRYCTILEPIIEAAPSVAMSLKLRLPYIMLLKTTE